MSATTSKVHDLTQLIYEGMPVGAGHMPTLVWPHDRHDERSLFAGRTWGSCAFILSDLASTHVVAPRHTDPNGESVDRLPPERFVTPAVCLDLREAAGSEPVTAEQVQSALSDAELDLPSAGAVLFWTGEAEDSPGIANEVIPWLAGQGIVMLGVNSTVDPPGRYGEALRECARHDLVPAQGLTGLDMVAGKRFTFVAPPLPIVDGAGSPVRAVAIEDDGDLGFAVRDGRARVVDLSQPIYAGMPVWVSEVQTRVWDVQTHELTHLWTDGKESWASNALLLSDHAGTHVDAIYHYVPDGDTMEEAPVDLFVTPAICIDLRDFPPQGYMTVEVLERALAGQGLEVPRGGTVLLDTGHFDRNYPGEEYLRGYPGLTRESTEWFADRGVVNIGEDALSTDNPLSPDYPSHLVAGERNLLLTENLAHLNRVDGKGFLYLGLPLPIKGASASPIRALAILSE